ncbi:unnamed protein product [Owenia fusiformis]|uniref:Uncharacterized protein n=1 Tax=Owenia fusiformis TaxID=6347 RepID=A0A8J1TDS7_OWEFU|nr:unnamed protein product [Owenia fusiformis]
MSSQDLEYYSWNETFSVTLYTMHHEPRNTVAYVLLAVLFVVIVTLTILGNALVCLAILLNRTLQRTTNYFILSLAVADLLLGIIVLPFSAILTSSKQWYFGIVWCNIDLSFDVMLCTASILNLFMISLERYFAITSPMTYQRYLTFRKVLIAIALVWVVSFLSSFVPIHLGWNTHAELHVNGTDITHGCYFFENQVYVVTLSLTTFFIPLFIMCATYARVLMIARKQAQEINKMSILACTESRTPQDQKHHKNHMVSEHKATITLAAIMGCFSICWIPYFVIFTIGPFINQNVIPEVVHDFVLWMGYINSTLNPILYAFLSKEFRKAFKRILHCKCKKR